MLDMLETGVLHSPLLRIQHEPRWLHNIEIIIYIIIFIYISIFIDISRSGRSGLFKVRLGSLQDSHRIASLPHPPPISFFASRLERPSKICRETWWDLQSLDPRQLPPHARVVLALVAVVLALVLVHHDADELDIIFIPGILQHRVICHDVLDLRLEILFAAYDAPEDGFACVTALEMLTLEPLPDAMTLVPHMVRALGVVGALALADVVRLALADSLLSSPCWLRSFLFLPLPMSPLLMTLPLPMSPLPMSPLLMTLPLPNSLLSSPCWLRSFLFLPLP